jgi:hypothetical protein
MGKRWATQKKKVNLNLEKRGQVNLNGWGNWTDIKKLYLLLSYNNSWYEPRKWKDPNLIKFPFFLKQSKIKQYHFDNWIVTFFSDSIGILQKHLSWQSNIKRAFHSACFDQLKGTISFHFIPTFSSQRNKTKHFLFTLFQHFQISTLYTSFNKLNMKVCELSSFKQNQVITLI